MHILCELLIIIQLHYIETIQISPVLYFNQVLEPRQTCDEIQEASSKLLQLGERSDELTGNINNIANQTMEKIREIDPQKVKVTSETMQGTL